MLLAVFITGVVLASVYCVKGDLCAETYENGNIEVKHREISIKENGSYLSWNHPYEMSGSVLSTVLSEIYYREKGFLTEKDKQRVFQGDEIEKLVPMIIQAFSVATPKQVVAVLSYSSRSFLSDKQNYCVMFMTNNNLNIVFSRIHKFLTYSDIKAEKRGRGVAKENPINMKSSRFWEIMPSSGQVIKPGHKNWLIIDVSKERYQEPTAVGSRITKKRQKVGYNRQQRMDRNAWDVDDTPQYSQTAPHTKPTRQEGSKIRQKLLILRELVKDGILLEEDYNYKKIKLLKEGMDDLSIKDRFREIKYLYDEGLITEKDYKQKKKELLDLF